MIALMVAGGLLTRQTAFYLHHLLYLDAVPQGFPTWDFWVQHVVDERNKIMIKAGQFRNMHPLACCHVCVAPAGTFVASRARRALVNPLTAAPRSEPP